MMRVKLRNDFSCAEITVDANRPLTQRKIRAWRRRLCSDECRSGDSLGGRGQQADQVAYDQLLLRAADVILSRRDE